MDEVCGGPLFCTLFFLYGVALLAFDVMLVRTFVKRQRGGSAPHNNKPKQQDEAEH